MAKRRRDIFETPNRKIRKRNRIIGRTILALLMLGIILTGIFYFFRIPGLQIREVVVTGADKVDESVVRAEAEQLAGGHVAYVIPQHFFLAYPKKEIAAALLERHKEINAAKVEFKGFKKVEIQVTERSPFVFYCTTTCYVADENGLVYEEASSTTDHVIFHDLRIEKQSTSTSPIGTHPLETSVFKMVEGFAQKISALNLHLEEVDIEENGDISVMTEEGKLIISVTESLDDQYEFLKTALTQKVFLYPDGAIRSFNYIDLRFGKKIFFKI